MADIIGWTASVILLVTLVRQIIKQVNDGQQEGVSSWLFIGQATASALFVVYSLLLENGVFIVTNSCILLIAPVGQWLTNKKSSEE